MTTKTRISVEEVEYEVTRPPSNPRWPKYSYPKVILLMASASLALAFTVIYYGIYLGTEEILQSIIHSNSVQVNVVEDTPTNEPAYKQRPDNLFTDRYFKTMPKPYYRAPRQKRDIIEDKSLDAMESEFNEFRAKIRHKRTRIELSKLEKDFTKCKKDALNHSECMDTFRKMYKIAKDISEKMEKMKEIFRESEFHLHAKSMSSSMEKFLNVDKSFKARNMSTTITPDSNGYDGEVTTQTDGKVVDVDGQEDANKRGKKLDVSENTTESSMHPKDLHLITVSDKSQTVPVTLPANYTDGVEKITPGFDVTTEVQNRTYSDMTLEVVTKGIAIEEEDFLVTEAYTTTDHTSTATDLHVKPNVTTKENEDLHHLAKTTESTRMFHPTTEGHKVSDLNTTSLAVMNATTEGFQPDSVHTTTEVFKATESDMITSRDLQNTTTSAHLHSTDPETTNRETTTTKGAITVPTKSRTEKLLNTTTHVPLNATTVEEIPATLDWSYLATVTTDVNHNSTTDATIHGERSDNLNPSSKTTSDIKINYGGKCGAINYEYKTPIEDDADSNICPPDDDEQTKEQSVQIKPPTDDATTSPVKKKDQPHENNDHPLDFPTSRENMLNEPTKSSAVNETWQKKFEDGAMEQKKNTTADAKDQTELMDSFGEFDHINADKFGPKMNPTNIAFGGNNRQLMTLCEHLARQMRSNVTSAPEKGDEITPSPNIQFTSRGPGFPVTGETMKASAQFLINPNFGIPSIPVCFYITPASFRMMMQPFWSPFFGMQGMSSGTGGNSGGSGGGIFIIPPSFGNMQNNGNFFGHSSPTASGSQSNIANIPNIPNIFSKSASSQQQQQQQKQQQFFCTYMQNSGKQSPGAGNTGGFNNVNFKLRNSSGNESSPTDIVYSSYWNKMPGYYGSNLGGQDRFKCPLEGDVPCYGGNECVPEKKWCDSTVDCSDGSDEAACTCRKRMQEHRICDGYQDCPLGEDEIGCFGCEKFMYSCYDNKEEFEWANRSTLAMCYSSVERCDGVKNCINGRDELGCNLIVGDLTHHMSHASSGSAGYLYRNHHGVWYPVCNNAQKWARQACAEDLGYLVDDPEVTFEEIELPGPFIEPHHMGEAHFPQSCQKRERDKLSDQVAYVRCPLPKCGIVNESTSPLLRSRRRRRRRRDTDDDESRIVGGSYSNPLQWPFIVALYRNGDFHCGGTIFNEQWIITAAHCTIGFHKYFYEVRAGMLRRSSFSSSTQIHHVTHVVVHQQYERRTMKNDLALLRIDSPLRYNRWVKPICLPDLGRTTMGDDWIWGPEVNTICTVVGWGAVREKGPGSDRLKEVKLPIRKRCTDKDDQEAEDICAGEMAGGRDACQGDSGGPLFCQSVSNNKEWYLAGVVSHGNGCARAREFGVYTRVALYLDWIEMALRPEYLPRLQPKQSCPGYVCIWGGQRCISHGKRCDRLVDCLGGEDEVGCIYNNIADVGAAQNASTTPMMHDMGSIEEQEETTTAGHNSTNLQGDLNDGGSIGSDTEPLFLETGENSTASTTDSPHPGLKSLVDWLNEEEKETTTESTTVPIMTKMWENSPKPIIDESTTSTPLPTSTADLTKLQNLAVKFLEALNGTTTHGTHIEPTTLPMSTSSATTESAQTITDEGFGEFKADLSEVSSEKPTSIHKRENATEEVTSTMMPKTMPKSIWQKFVCKKIPQIIDISNRCDRIADCEDGTDEDGCTCRQYLKGPLNILICDGKVDCGDLTDEDNCGNCSASQFLCPMSKTCIDSVKRCDNFVDCPFKEDEKDCFALTNGKEVHLDINKRPSLQSSGIFSSNVQGLWRVVCSHETGYHFHNAKTAEEVCSLLGFKGVRFYNTTQISHHTIAPIEPNLVQMAYMKDRYPIGDSVHFMETSKHMPMSSVGITSARSERIEKVSENCLGLFVECAPKSNGSVPIKTLTAGDEFASNIVDIHGFKPIVKTDISTIFVTKKEEILDKLNKLIETKKPVLVHDKLHEGFEKLHWPWLVDVYANGKLWCVGVLVDKHWVLVHESCYHGLRLTIDYVTVLLGGGKNKHTLHKSPHEQIKRVDCFEAVEGCDVLLLHLDYAAHFTRHVLPTFLPEILLAAKENGTAHDKTKLECMSVVHDKFGRIKVTPTVGKSAAAAAKTGQELHNNASGTMCAEDNEQSCYQWDPMAIVDYRWKHFGEDKTVALANQEEEMKTLSDFCKDLDSGTKYPHSHGVIVCREDNTGWYPMAFYTYNSRECNNLKQPFPVRTLERYYGYIQDIIDQPKCGNGHARPPCPTLRCPLGNCLLPEQMCNGKVDCHDGSDEETEFCRLHRHECKASELKCRSNGKCVPKTKFCDHIADCEDLTDEPTICSCFTYLQATDPGKICDGIRNCWDKSDESPVLCNCTSSRFPCGSSRSECIPKDFVCDKEPDCPNGEDEHFCYAVEHPIMSPTDTKSSKHPPFPQAYGQVIEQSYGVWHTKCFPRHRPPNSEEAAEICRKLGYNGNKPPSYRLIDDNTDIVAAAELQEGFTDSPVQKYREATKAVVINKFSPLHLNDDLTLILKPSRPIAELVKWNKTDSENCYRLEIKCG